MKKVMCFSLALATIAFSCSSADAFFRRCKKKHANQSQSCETQAVQAPVVQSCSSCNQTVSQPKPAPVQVVSTPVVRQVQYIQSSNCVNGVCTK